jgi:hypothetical protein
MRSITFDDQATWYVPDIDGNREDPDPFAILISPMSGAERASLERSAVMLEPGANGETTVAARVRDRVIEVRGYRVTNVHTGRVITPTTGAGLVEAIAASPATEHGLVSLIVAAIQSRSVLTEGARKNLPWLCDSGPAVTSPGAGASQDGPANAQPSSAAPATATVATPSLLLVLPGRPSSGAAPGVPSTPLPGCASLGGATGGSTVSLPGVEIVSETNLPT